MTQKISIVLALLAIGLLSAGRLWAQDSIGETIGGLADDVVDVVTGNDGEEPEEDETPGVDEMLAIADAARPAMVQVEYTLQYDKGESPYFYGGTGNSVGSRVIEQERPAEVSGLLVGPNTVITGDLMLHPRFIESLAVRFGDDVVPATISGFAVGHDAMMLTLERPLQGAQAVAFDSEAAGPYQAAFYVFANAEWSVRVRPFAPVAVRTIAGESFQIGPDNALIVNGDGVAVGALFDSELPADDSWKGSPLDWEFVSADDMAAELATLEQRANGALLRVAMNFRSPKKAPGYAYDRSSGGEVGTERNVVGVLIGPKRVLVLAQLDPKTTTRLERVQIYPGDGGEAVEANFVASLKDYGGLLVELAEPMDGAVVIADDDVRDYENKVLMLAEIRIQGDNRVAYFLRNRITGFYKSWRQNIYPSIPGDEEDVFLFSEDGRLIAFPISHRPKPTVQQSRGYNRARTTAAAQLAAVLNAEDMTAHVDANNIPLTEEEENRLAWMGIALQGLTRELARVNNVSDVTRDGQTGAIVSWVYPDSPAAEAGVEPGWILLRLDVDGEPKPLEVQASGYIWESQPFPWQYLDQIPVTDFEDAPTPWPPAENEFRRALTDVGFGRSYTARFSVDGEIVIKEFEVVESPEHYESAAKQEFESLGLTIRDLTFELQHYFRKMPGDPGVVISKIETGSRADVGKLKPFEIITHVNNEPVHSVEQFAQLIEDQAELRLDVMRMTRGRVVKIKTDVAPADEPVGPVDDEIPAIPDETIEEVPAEEIPAVVP
jgi:serine protease Do